MGMYKRTMAKEIMLHVLTPAAFIGRKEYDFNEVLCISKEQFKTLGVTSSDLFHKHREIEYKDFAKNNNSIILSQMKNIELEALLDAELPRNFASYAVKAAYNQLKKWKAVPTGIPFVEAKGSVDI